MKSVRVNADDQAVYEILYDLSESQRDDRQIVAAETQNGNADQESRNSGEDRADNDREKQTEPLVGNGVGERRRNDRAGECADAHEARVPERKFAHDADGQVQRDRHDNVTAGGNEPALLRTGKRSRGIKSRYNDEHDDDEKICRVIVYA